MKIFSVVLFVMLALLALLAAPFRSKADATRYIRYKQISSTVWATLPPEFSIRMIEGKMQPVSFETLEQLEFFQRGTSQAKAGLINAHAWEVFEWSLRNPNGYTPKERLAWIDGLAGDFARKWKVDRNEQIVETAYLACDDYWLKSNVRREAKRRGKGFIVKDEDGVWRDLPQAYVNGGLKEGW